MRWTRSLLCGRLTAMQTGRRRLPFGAGFVAVVAVALVVAVLGRAASSDEPDASACGLETKIDSSWRTNVEGTGLTAEGAYEFVFASEDDAQSAAEAQSEEPSSSPAVAMEYLDAGFVMEIPDPQLRRVLVISEDPVGDQRGCGLVELFDTRFRQLGFAPTGVHALTDSPG